MEKIPFGVVAPLASSVLDHDDPLMKKMVRWFEEHREQQREQQRFDAITAALVEAVQQQAAPPPPPTIEERREKLCFELRQEGKSYEQINLTLKKHPDFEHFKDSRSVRRLIEAGAKRAGITLASGQPGRPKKKTSRRRKAN
jgi:hypothetical protein